MQIDAAVVVRRRRPRPPPPFVLHLRRRLPCPPAAATPDTQISLLYRPFLLVLSQAPLSPGVLSPGHRFFLPLSGELSSRLISFGLDFYRLIMLIACVDGVAQAAHHQQVRHYAKKERSRAPLTPTKSKVKKYKIKAPS